MPYRCQCGQWFSDWDLWVLCHQTHAPNGDVYLVYEDVRIYDPATGVGAR